MRDFSGKTAVVTGAGSGIGQALALGLASHGARLALSDVDESRVAGTVERCRQLGAAATGYKLDVADRDAVFAHAEQVDREFGGVRLVVNNAGVALGAEVTQMSMDDMDWLMGVNFWGVVHGTKAFLPQLIANGDAHLVNISSVFGFIGVPTQSAYNAAKFGVRGFTEALRQEMLIAGHRVGVSCVHPGGIRTNIARDARIAGDDLPDRAAADRGFQRIARTTPERAARTILDGVRRNRARILIGADARVIDALPRLLGPRYQGIVAAVVKTARRFIG
ncbi:NADP-dependent 3-hydroxy acid dehydrogenase YdfG [Tamaricihabitans halophyticus]|uniref:NADP-dependent 3-hydroxy acid dehydrogenase YdfG n=1 Tax=Tamaricihabitans halophyticus TaxID=1262583 RepID=A0A4R2R5D8_9PSEU|nr:SDR family NAD(P)-dependent oxidoreductase [Tamaricihabitans halophyticus]TCP57247.1 NADP-dependent 3-hydroxy acid dehydrogenase YdfG [Tamaricihabitans halophyticus]